MAGTPTTVTRILGRLTSDGTLTGTLLPGGIYNRPLKREGPGSTDGAWDALDGRIKGAAVVVDGTDEQTAFGPDGSFVSFPWVYIYAEPHENGKTRIANAWDQIFGLLHKWHFATGNGTDAEVQVIGRLGVMDDPDATDRVMGGMRLQVSGLWRRTG
jgi:hypothetical protein